MIININACAWRSLSDKNWLKTQTENSIKVKDEFCGCPDCIEKRKKQTPQDTAKVDWRKKST